jgi:uncharacterized protein YjeT (DUF2065 family)
MDGRDFLTAVALLLIFEGLMPFASPERWKEVIRSIAQLEASKIRMFGFMSMVGGLILLYGLNY